MAAPLIPWIIGGGALYGLYKWIMGSKPSPDDPIEPPVVPGVPPDGGGGGFVKVSPDNPEGTVADYNEFFNKGRNVVDQAIYDEKTASDSGETYCESTFGGCVGNINHLTAARKSIKTNQGRLGFDAGVYARASELGLSVSEDGDLF